jgi:mitochondrial fission protein ELM1
LLKWLKCPVSVDQTSALWVVKNKLGLVAVISTWLMLTAGEIIFFLFVIIPFHDSLYSAFHGILSLAGALLAVVAQFQAAFTNPVRRKSFS